MILQTLDKIVARVQLTINKYKEGQYAETIESIKLLAYMYFLCFMGAAVLLSVFL